MKRGIFVSYRRDDAAHITGRIHDDLASRFGAGNVFMDVDSVAPGEDFVRKIEDTIAACDVFLVVMGPRWLGAETAAGQRRIDLPGDFVRIELRAALERGVRIIPVLVDGAVMPRQDELPEDVAQLVRHNAVFLNHATFRRDMDALAAGLEPQAPWSRLRSPVVAAAAAGAVAVLALTLAVSKPGAPGRLPDLSSTVSLELAGSDRLAAVAIVRDIGFRAERDGDGRLHIRADVPYRDRLYDGGEVSGLPFLSAPFRGVTAPLEITLTNRSAEPVSISELLFEVAGAQPDLRPVPVLREHEVDYRRLRVSNEGWGPMEPVRLEVKRWGLPAGSIEQAERRWRGDLVLWDPCAEPGAPTAGQGGVLEPEMDEGGSGAAWFDLEGMVPAAYDGSRFVCAEGTLTYTSLGQAQVAAFRTRISNRMPDSIVAAPARSMYDLYLDAEREGYVAVVPAQLDVPPGETVKAFVSVLTNKSSEFSLVQSARTADGQVIAGEAFTLEIFMPRSGGGGYVLSPDRWVPVPDEALAGLAGRSLVQSVFHDPQGREAAQVTLNEPLEEDACLALAEAISGRIARLGQGETAAVDAIWPESGQACRWPVGDQRR